MADKTLQVMLPFGSLPTTEGVRCAIANIIRDIQSEYDLTDLQFASKIEVHVNTIERARNKKGTLETEVLNRIGAVFGDGAMGPIKALWGRQGLSEHTDPKPALSEALTALLRANGAKAELDALPAAKDCIAALEAWVREIEAKRMRLVA